MPTTQPPSVSWASATYGYVYLDGGTLQINPASPEHCRDLNETNGAIAASVISSLAMRAARLISSTVPCSRFAGINTWAYDGDSTIRWSVNSSDNSGGGAEYDRPESHFVPPVLLYDQLAGTFPDGECHMPSRFRINTVTFGSNTNTRGPSLNGNSVTIAGSSTSSSHRPDGCLQDGNGSNTAVTLTLSITAVMTPMPDSRIPWYWNWHAGADQDRRHHLTLTNTNSTYSGATTIPTASSMSPRSPTAR